MDHTPDDLPVAESSTEDRSAITPDNLRRELPADPKADSSLVGFLWRTLIVLIVISVLRFTAPVIVEEFQYAVTRGRQRAEYETAGEYLPNAELGQLSSAYQMVSQRVCPSVVHINVSVHEERGQMRLGHAIRSVEHGQGSGVIVDAQGHILTNYHVVKYATDIDVALSDGRRVGAEVIGADELTDLAVLKIKAKDLIPATWGDSDQVHEGALVWAVGSPYGLQRSITSGILSAKNRGGVVGKAHQEFLQTDAAVNRGNSGGPLVDASGNVIGINTMIVGESFLGISFAVPSKVAKDVCEKLLVQGRVPRGWLGVQLASWSQEPDARGAPRTGARVVALVDRDDSSPAIEAGLQEGDVVVRWNDQEIDSPTALTLAVAHTKIGTQAEVRIIRGGAEISTKVRVAERPQDLN